MKSKRMRARAFAAPLTVAAALALVAETSAQSRPRTSPSTSGTQQPSSSGPGSSSAPSPTDPMVEINTRWLDLFKTLGFPYGTQTFEGLRRDTSITETDQWEQFGAPGSLLGMVTRDGVQGLPRPGTNSRTWLHIQDNGATAGDELCSRPIQAPQPWDYSWSLALKVERTPVGGGDWPMLASQHDGNGGFHDAWGIVFTDTGAELHLTSAFGVADSLTLFSYTDMGVASWVDLRVLASFETNRLEAFVNGFSVGYLGMNPGPGENLSRLRLAYHGQGAGAITEVLIDDVVLAFGSPVCKEDYSIDFTTDDNGAPLANGQDISSPDEFGFRTSMASGGPNAGAAIFDSSTAGPNNPSQDLDLLVDQGNILILQTDGNTTQTVPGIFDRPNDDEDGGSHTWTFSRAMQPLSIDLIDIDAGANEGVQITLTDASGNERVYMIPADWTGDLTNAEPGVGTLDLTTLANQAGWNSMAMATEDAGYDGSAVVSLVVETNGSCGLDNFVACIPCVELDFETEDDGVTVLDNGQDLSTPPEFGLEVSISSFGPNLGAAIFDSTPFGPNDPGPDRDLLVGLGNILILQNTTASTQTVPGYFDTPNDDQDGGSIVLSFPGPVRAHRIDVIDFDEEDVDGIQIVLVDQSANTRTYTVPGGFTEDILNDGPTGFRTLDLETLAAQPGFLASATASESGPFDADDVIEIRLEFGGPGAVDNLCFCPQ
jgi:hypothetical protein